MDLMKRLSKAKTGLILEHPFIGSVAINMPFELDETISTAGTNGKRVRFNPAFIEKLTDEELKKFRGLKTEQAVLDAQEQKRINDGLKDAAKASDDANKEAAAKRKAEADKKLAEDKQFSQELLKNQQDRRKLLQQDNLVSQKQVAQDEKDAKDKAKKEQELMNAIKEILQRVK